jgi:ATP-binding cassette, subfamily D (ALD), member 3
LDGEFRANHKKIIDHSEEIAFYNGNDWEFNKLSDNFNNLTKHINSVLIKKFFMGIFDAMLVKFGATIVGTIILGMPVFTGKFERYKQRNKNQNAAEITKDYIQNSSLLQNLAKAIGKVIISYKDLQDLSGYTYLVNELAQVISDINMKKYSRNQIDQSLVEKYTGGVIEENDFIEFQDVPIITPNGEGLIEHINIKVIIQYHIIINI